VVSLFDGYVIMFTLLIFFKEEIKSEIYIFVILSYVH